MNAETHKRIVGAAVKFARLSLHLAGDEAKQVIEVTEKWLKGEVDIATVSRVVNTARAIAKSTAKLDTVEWHLKRIEVLKQCLEIARETFKK